MWIIIQHLITLTLIGYFHKHLFHYETFLLQNCERMFPRVNSYLLFSLVLNYHFFYKSALFDQVSFNDNIKKGDPFFWVSTYSVLWYVFVTVVVAALSKEISCKYYCRFSITILFLSASYFLSLVIIIIFTSIKKKTVELQNNSELLVSV